MGGGGGDCGGTGRKHRLDLEAQRACWEDNKSMGWVSEIQASNYPLYFFPPLKSQYYVETATTPFNNEQTLR